MDYAIYFIGLQHFQNCKNGKERNFCWINIWKLSLTVIQRYLDTIDGLLLLMVWLSYPKSRDAIAFKNSFEQLCMIMTLSFTFHIVSEAYPPWLNQSAHSQNNSSNPNLIKQYPFAVHLMLRLWKVQFHEKCLWNLKHRQNEGGIYRLLIIS